MRNIEGATFWDFSSIMSNEIEAVIHNDQDAIHRVHSMRPGRQKSTRGSYGLGGMQVSETEARAILNGFANQDDNSNKTWSRQFVERFLIDVRPLLLCPFVRSQGLPRRWCVQKFRCESYV